jgi:hypothetical protein
MWTIMCITCGHVPTTCEWSVDNFIWWGQENLLPSGVISGNFTGVGHD